MLLSLSQEVVSIPGNQQTTCHLEEYAHLQSEPTARTCLTQTVTSTDSDLPPFNILHMFQYILITLPGMPRLGAGCPTGD